MLHQIDDEVCGLTVTVGSDAMNTHIRCGPGMPKKFEGFVAVTAVLPKFGSDMSRATR